MIDKEFRKALTYIDWDNLTEKDAKELIQEGFTVVSEKEAFSVLSGLLGTKIKGITKIKGQPNKKTVYYLESEPHGRIFIGELRNVIKYKEFILHVAETTDYLAEVKI